METPGPEITHLIACWQSGDKSAEKKLFEILYQRLHGLAIQCLRTEPRGQSMGATALVNEAYVRFVRAERIEVANTRHFISLSAQVMRHILADRARARLTRKRDAELIPLDDAASLVRTDTDAHEILGVELAMQDLSRKSPRLARLVELHHFIGYTLEQSAEVLNISERQAKRDWTTARVRLRLALAGEHTLGAPGAG